jgi:peroxiredoxin
MLRGYNGAHCPYCTAQTNSLFHNKAELDKFDAQLLVVYPGQSTMLDEFLTKAGSTIKTAPCPILLDENFQAVDQLGIRGELAKPSTYIIDKQGQVRYAYVGASLSDRPSVKAILTQLQALQPKPTKS